MRWLLACQKNGLLRELLRSQGHDAWTCDLEPSEDSSPFHLREDVIQVLGRGWDAMFACPECRNLSVSGQHWNDKPGHRTSADVDAAAAFFMQLALADIPRVAVENSIGIMSTRWRKPDQILQPYYYGDDASKATCLWLRNLPPLLPTRRIYGRMVQTASGRLVERWANQTDSGQNRLSPSPTRSADRARNYPGIVRAMAEQWGRGV